MPRHDLAIMLGFALAIAALSAPRATAVEINGRAQWGLAGRPVERGFCLLSIPLSNPGRQTFEGPLKLTRPSSGEQIVEPVYLGPGQQRWVQLLCHMESDYDDWIIELDGKTYSFPSEEAGPRERILLTEPEGLHDSKLPLRRLPDNLFPASVTGTENLELVALGHAPRWDGARQQAFIDWIWQGGTVHLFQDHLGKPPEFVGALAVLAPKRGLTRLGLGHIVWHEQRLSEADERSLADSAETVVVDPKWGQSARRQWRAALSQSPFGQGQGVTGLADHMITAIKNWTSPQHNWTLIYTLAGVYLASFVITFALGARRFDYRIVFSVLIISVVVFTYLFQSIGQRGYGEKTSLHSLAIARPVSPGAYDVRSVSHLFVTGGGWYSLPLAGSGATLALDGSGERANARLTRSSPPVYEIEMPSFSTRGFIGASRQEGPDFSFQFEPLGTAATETPIAVMPVESLPDTPWQLRPGDRFPTDTLGVNLLSVNELIVLKKQGEVYIEGSRMPLANYFAIHEVHSTNEDSGRRESLEAMYESLVPKLTLWGLVTDRSRDTMLPQNLLRLVVVAPLPTSWQVETSQVPNQQGRVVYWIDPAGMRR